MAVLPLCSRQGYWWAEGIASSWAALNGKGRPVGGVEANRGVSCVRGICKEDGVREPRMGRLARGPSFGFLFTRAPQRAGWCSAHFHSVFRVVFRSCPFLCAWARSLQQVPGRAPRHCWVGCQSRAARARVSTEDQQPVPSLSRLWNGSILSLLQCKERRLNPASR